MARHARGVTLMVVGIVALALGAHLIIIPEDLAWRVAGIALVVVACPVVVASRLLLTARRPIPEPRRSRHDA